MPRKLGEKTLQRIAEVQIQIDALKKKRYPDEYLTCFNKHLDVYKERIDKLWSYTLDIRATPDKQNAKNLGIKKYIWRTAGDSRVCARCAERDGKIFRWDETLPGGHPGEAPCCRCVALGIVDESQLYEIEPGNFRLVGPTTESSVPKKRKGLFHYLWIIVVIVILVAVIGSFSK